MSIVTCTQIADQPRSQKKQRFVWPCAQRLQRTHDASFIAVKLLRAFEQTALAIATVGARRCGRHWPWLCVWQVRGCFHPSQIVTFFELICIAFDALAHTGASQA